MSPRSKQQFDEIDKKRKEIVNKNNGTPQDLLNFYLGQLPEVPNRYHWKIFLELAEIFKKDCNHGYAKTFYKIAAQI